MLNGIDHWMRSQFKALSETFWFVPTIVSLFGPLLAACFLMLDSLGIDARLKEPLLFRSGVAAATSLLSTIAGSLITVAGLAFSVTIVALQLMSSQYTPRALRGFLQDRVTQYVAGGFFGIFSYALIVMATINESPLPNHGFVPQLSITIAIALGFVGLALLLVFIHHTGRVIQVSDIAARTAEQTLQAIDQLYAEEIREIKATGISAQVQSVYTHEKPASIFATRSGYIQRIELAHLIEDIMRPRIHLKLTVAPGDFVTDETVIAEVWPAEAASVIVIRALRHHIRIERERDIMYDAKFGARQLTDIALRALSPAVNDPTTGVLCIKYLRAVFEHLARLPVQPSIYDFAQGTSSLSLRRPTFQEYIRMYVEIGLYAGGNIRVISTLLHALIGVAHIINRFKLEERADVVRMVSTKIVVQAREQTSNEQDRIHMQELLLQIENVLEVV